MSSSTLVLTSSYPTYPGDAAGHFVEAEVEELVAAGQNVRVLAAGKPSHASHTTREFTQDTASVADGFSFGPRPESAHSSSKEPLPARCAARVEWLGGEALFGSPGALARLVENPARLGALPLPWLRAARALARAPEQNLIVHWLLPFAPLALTTSQFTHIECVAHGSDVALLRRCPAPLSRAWLEALARKDVALRLVSSRLREDLSEIVEGHARAQLRDGLRAERSRTRLIRDWLARAEIRPSPLRSLPVPPRDVARARLGVPAGAPVAVVVARLIASKRVDVALRALASGGWTIWVVGDGPLRAPLMKQFPRAHFWGQLPRDEALLRVRAADVLVSASLHEGAPTVVREARQLGTRVVAVEAGDLREWSRLDPGITVVNSRSHTREALPGHARTLGPGPAKISLDPR